MSDQQNSPIQLDPNMALNANKAEGLKWLSPREAPFQILGFPWLEQDGVYRRLPLKPSHPVPPAVDALANHTSGGQIRFRTDSAKLHLRVRLKAVANMYHMPATGQCGFDCYVGAPGEQLYYSTTRYNHTQLEYEAELFYKVTEREMRDITLNFPLYQGVEEVLVGVEPDAQVAPPTPFAGKGRVIFYGTSITQGGCATRPGMSHTNILSRMLQYEVVNLGFSGNGRGEPELAHIIAQIPDPACFVLEYEGNVADAESLERTLPEFIRILRESHPKVPILVPSRIRYSREFMGKHLVNNRLAKKQVIIDTVERLRAQGDQHLHFMDGEHLLGEAFNEATVDGSHPTDFGFYHMALGMAPVLSKLLAGR